MSPQLRRLGAKIVSSRNISSKVRRAKAKEVSGESLLISVGTRSIAFVVGVTASGWWHSKMYGRPVTTILGFTVGKYA
ncbi:hypothetical protein MKW94_018277 [Papaver nudicaule]|uniref:Uncharacterized protein n=1 Tax=Papaver nudicaule TaxID=74823 RepID=A0AA41VJA3_PAPNU|nr:hypothetical protein [Papaver nudicaule]